MKFTFKPIISNFLRLSGLIYYSDLIRYRIEKFRNSKKNDQFIINNPEVSIPPNYMIYESFRLDYDKYYHGGLKTAQWIINIVNTKHRLDHFTILDWGCGPGRVVRHLPRILDSRSNIHGTDYNEKSILWCKQNIDGVEFNHNNLEAKLPYPDNKFDAIYGISVLTHLSEKMNYDWVLELKRILSKDGVLIVTVQGDNHFKLLSKNEQSSFNSGKLVVRANVKEGHRTYSAFHPEMFMKKLFVDFDILDIIRVSPERLDYIPQDTWILKNKSW